MYLFQLSDVMLTWFIQSAILRPRVARPPVEASSPASSVRKKLEGRAVGRRGMDTLRNKPSRFELDDYK